MGRYDDMLRLPHPEPRTRPRMPLADRAAQFSSFAALSGYEDAVAETARLTDVRRELDRDALEALDAALSRLRERIGETPEAEIRYFVPDEKKSGGRYETVRSGVKKLDEYGAQLVLADGKKIPLSEITAIEVL